MIGEVNYVTVATDASVSEKSGRTGLAYYIRDNEGTTKHAWFVNEVVPSNIAEWLALEAAIKAIVERGYPKDTHLVFYCDFETMLRILGDELKSAKAMKNWGAQAEWVKEQLSNFVIIARYVESHTKPTDGNKRHFLNRWCDYNARAMARHGRLHEWRTA